MVVEPTRDCVTNATRVATQSGTRQQKSTLSGSNGRRKSTNVNTTSHSFLLEILFSVYMLIRISHRANSLCIHTTLRMLSMTRCLMSNGKPPTHLAYVELFQPFTPVPDPKYGMYKVSWSLSATGNA